MEESSSELDSLYRQFKDIALSLQRDLGDVDRVIRLESGQKLIKQLVATAGRLKLRMSPDKNHMRPHLHIDYGVQRHVMSIAVDTAEVLAGSRATVPHKYVERTRYFTERNRDSLLEIWAVMKRGDSVRELITDLPPME